MANFQIAHFHKVISSVLKQCKQNIKLKKFNVNELFAVNFVVYLLFAIQNGRRENFEQDQ